MRALLGVLVAAMAAVACAANHAPTPEFVFPVLVENHGFYDATVYLASANGQAIRRLGIVTGNSSQRYALTGPQIRPGNAIAFYAKTIGEGQQYHSGLLVIFAGARMRWVLQPHGYDLLVPLVSKAAE